MKTQSETKPPRLSVCGICKHFGGIQALKNISFEIAAGEIHALVGENGAGKSTLVKIITGIEQADDGHILYDGTRLNFSNSMMARENGVIAVYQDPKLFPNLDIAENVFMGIHPRSRRGTVDWKTMYRKTKEILNWLEADLDPHTLVASLSIAEMQYVEFARAMFAGNERLLILDEPTAALSPQEAEKVFQIVRRLKAKGVSIIYISHRLEELFGFADSITIMRDGEYVTTQRTDEISQEQVVKYMVGRAINDLYGQKEIHSIVDPSKPLLRVENLCSEGEFADISFVVHPGEIVGMAGLVGAGRTEIAKALFGDLGIHSGKLSIDGKECIPKSPKSMIDNGLVYIPEDRETEGLIPDLSVIQNMTLPALLQNTRMGIVDREKELKLYDQYKSQFQIKSSSPNIKVSSLSGGNRQKVVLSKWMASEPKIIILDEPTHGIDVGSKAQVHEVMKQLASEGIGILMISSDLPEILRMSDRILVVSHGRLVKTMDNDNVTQEEIMMYATQSMEASE